MTALTLVKDSKTLGHDLTKQVAQAHIQEERNRLEKKINGMLVDGDPSYQDILELTSFAPDVKNAVYDSMRYVRVERRVKQEIASHLVLRSPKLEKKLVDYIRGVEKIQRPDDVSIPRHLATATDKGLLEDVVKAGYAGIIAIRELGDDNSHMKAAIDVVNEFDIFGSTELQEQVAQFVADYNKKHGPRLEGFGWEIWSIRRSVERTLKNATCEAIRRCHRGGALTYIDKDLLEPFGKTIVKELEAIQQDTDTTASYLKMIKGLCVSGEFPGFDNEHVTAQLNAKNFSDTVTYVQVLEATLQKVPLTVKQAFYDFVAETQREEKVEFSRCWGESYLDHSLRNHLRMTLSVANQLYQWEGGVREGSENKEAACEAIKILHQLEAEKKVSDHGWLIPTRFYRAAMTLPVNSIAAYGKMLEVGLTEDEQFGLASRKPLQKLLQEQPVPVVETLYATAITTLRASNWHYAMKVLENGTLATQKLVDFGGRGLKVLEGGERNDA